jgi:catechol 2,3-dioxygenase-like lactoylglutathione lyase family enzyme
MTRLATVVLVVRDLERALALYEQGLGFARVEDASDVPSLGARHVVLRAENCLLELLEPHDEKKPPGLFLRARGEGVFSLALEVGDPVEASAQLAARFVDPRGAADDPQRWYVSPADAHGLLLQVSPAASA